MLTESYARGPDAGAARESYRYRFGEASSLPCFVTERPWNEPMAIVSRNAMTCAPESGHVGASEIVSCSPVRVMSVSRSWNASLNHVRGNARRTILSHTLNIVAIGYSGLGCLIHICGPSR
jgi:hypothetical protein